MTKVFFQTHGCSVNFSETEQMKGILAKWDFEIIGDMETADVIIINVCTVKGENTALREIKKINEDYGTKKLIVAGCLTEELIENVKEVRDDVSFINTDNIKRITEVVEEEINDNHIELLSKEKELKLNLPKIRKNPAVGIVPILNSCALNCSYCSVKEIKGELFSYPIEDITKEVEKCLNDGCKEIWITSQDNAAYGIENKENKLPLLLNNILEINKDFFVRIGMMNPSNVLPILDPLVEIYKNKKIFKFLHIPVQSGNNKILRLMNRNYTVDDFKKIANRFREAIPNITISSDIICGFPTETEEQFKDSLNLIKEIKPDVLNISRFMARPGTKAAHMEGQIAGGVSKDRSRLLTDIFGNIARMQNEKWLDWEGEVLIDEIGKNDSFIGRNFAYKPVIVKGDFKLGDIVNVRIRSVTSYDLRAEDI
ncbi:tRNA (N(6)-L-threonylcarbamoyladenosine(37)-C(2))-methylthiotransferase [Candidatus Woesearchaeota archaeon]|nr:tRNA (N(6)-L-threonylcarbamoyladenosine(37)-C(2))-methylthiotransferase [Candidatus Woesearchaeota archaeon]